VQSELLQTSGDGGADTRAMLKSYIPKGNMSPQELEAVTDMILANKGGLFTDIIVQPVFLLLSYLVGGFMKPSCSSFHFELHLVQCSSTLC
jgi:hypothetical protein